MKGTACEGSAMSKRLFVGIDLADLAPSIAEVQGEFGDASGLSLTDPAQAHLTLKFLGDTPPDRVDAYGNALETAVDRCGLTPFSIELGGLGVFPDTEYIRVIWIGVRDGATAVTTLHEAVERALVQAGADPADHAFTPHCTIARMRHAGSKALVQDLVESRDPDVGTGTVETVDLFESIQTDHGPRYERRRVVAL
jgi:2'-5' RNA ligase